VVASHSDCIQCFTCSLPDKPAHLNGSGKHAAILQLLHKYYSHINICPWSGTNSFNTVRWNGSTWSVHISKRILTRRMCLCNNNFTTTKLCLHYKLQHQRQNIPCPCNTEVHQNVSVSLAHLVDAFLLCLTNQASLVWILHSGFVHTPFRNVHSINQFFYTMVHCNCFHFYIIYSRQIWNVTNNYSTLLVNTYSCFKPLLLTHS